MKLEQKVIRLLTQSKKTVSVAESCTGGLLAQRLTRVPGASRVFGFGIVAYSAKAKQKLLKIKPALIKKQGQVSQGTALAMAKGVRRLSHSDYAISITGIAGPSGGTRQKPVGTVYLSLISRRARHIKKCLFAGNRNQIRQKTTTLALKWLCEILTSH